MSEALDFRKYAVNYILKIKRFSFYTVYKLITEIQ
jgi:hypothetical protein